MPDPVYKTVEVTATSSGDVTHAVQNAVDKASETLRNINWFELVAVRGSIDEGRSSSFRRRTRLASGSSKGGCRGLQRGSECPHDSRCARSARRHGSTTIAASVTCVGARRVDQLIRALGRRLRGC